MVFIFFLENEARCEKISRDTKVVFLVAYSKKNTFFLFYFVPRDTTERQKYIVQLLKT